MTCVIACLIIIRSEVVDPSQTASHLHGDTSECSSNGIIKPKYTKLGSISHGCKEVGITEDITKQDRYISAGVKIFRLNFFLFVAIWKFLSL